MDNNQSIYGSGRDLPSPSADDDMSYSAYMEKNARKEEPSSSTSDTLSSFASAMRVNLKTAQEKLSTGFHRAADKFDQMLTQAEPNLPYEDASSLTVMLAEQLQCGWCKQLLNGPVTLPCGHSYCNGCWQQIVTLPTQPPACPCEGCDEPAPTNPPLSVSLCGVSAILRSRIETEKAMLAKQAADVTDTSEALPQFPLELTSDSGADVEDAAERRYSQNPYGDQASENYANLLADPAPRTAETDQGKESRIYKLWGSVKEKSSVIGTQLGSQLKEIGEKAHQGMSDVALRAQKQYRQARGEAEAKESNDGGASSYGVESGTEASAGDADDESSRASGNGQANVKGASEIKDNADSNMMVEEDERFSLE